MKMTDLLTKTPGRYPQIPFPQFMRDAADILERSGYGAMAGSFRMKAAEFEFQLAEAPEDPETVTITPLSGKGE